jgi:hypothetical protein
MLTNRKRVFGNRKCDTLIERQVSLKPCGAGCTALPCFRREENDVLTQAVVDLPAGTAS